jgi:hypothetical protein
MNPDASPRTGNEPNPPIHNPNQNMKRPPALTIVGAMWFLLGFSGLMVKALQTSAVEVPDSNWLIMLAGVGLWRGWRLARWYALVVAGVCFASAVLFGPWMLMNASEIVYQFPTSLYLDQRPHELMALPLLLLLMAGYLGFTGWSFWVLKRSDVREFFARTTMGERPATVS